MKNYPLTIVLICICMLPKVVYAQKGKINGTYVWEMVEYLTISEDSFKLSLYRTYPVVYGLNRNDTILAEGKVKYEGGNFIQLTSKDYEWEAEKNVTVTESVDSSLSDSIRFNFIFPFDGQYSITMFLGDISKDDQYVYENTKNIIIPAPQDSILKFSFTILNQTPIKSPYGHRNYRKTIAFTKYNNIAKKTNSNAFEISIPDLTNSYFNRYLINGEYIKFDKKREELDWHNERYWKSGCSYATGCGMVAF